MISKGSLLPYGAPILRREILANSTTFTAGDAVIFDTDGFVALATAGAALLGHVSTISTDGGVGLNTSGAAGAAIGSFYGTFLTTSDNETVAKVRGDIDISIFTLFAGQTDANLETTAGSSQRGVYFDLADEDSVDESTVADTTAQVHSWGPNPQDTTDEIIYNIRESSVFTAA